MTDREKIIVELDQAERKAWDSLSRYKFQMFGYWAAIWVHLNRLAETKRPNPWKKLVSDARVCLSERGQAIAEFAIMLPVFVLVAFALIDCQWLIKDAADLDYIVSESARCEAIQNPTCATASGTAAYATQLGQTFRLDTTAPNFTLTTPPCAQTCTVTIAYKYKPLGAVFPRTLTLSRTGTAAVAPVP